MNRSIALVGVVACALTLSACDLTELNENPNESTQPVTGFILSRAEVNLAQNYFDSFNNGRFGLLYAQYWTQNQYTSEDRYQYRENVVDAYWTDLYLVISNLQELKRLVPEDEAAVSPENQVAVADIMQVFAFHVMTDIWGDIPYTEALQGRDNRVPAFTPQEEIYPDLIRRLTEDQAMIDVAGTVPGDLIYGGNAARWKRFANSLKMRIAMRMSDQLPDQAAQAIQEAIAAGPMNSVADAAILDFTTSEPYTNPIYENYEITGRDDWAVTEGLVTTLQERNDPRLPIYVAPTPRSVEVTPGAPVYEGLPYGLAQGVAAAIPRSNFSRPGEITREATSPAIFMLYDEVLFIKAEAAARGFISGDADDLFEDAVRTSFEYWGVDDQDVVEDYVSDLPDLDGSNYRQVLGVQKWLALYMQGIQGWSEWRRLDFTGVLIEPVGGKLDSFEGPIPVRLVYPTQEEALNSDNLAAAIASQGPDTQGTRVWWDVAPIGL
ncbi:SusD/RagB family nutrient-binding outer membrane lipoprotein [Rubrivirga sp. S365]|uniref:SusD/RagB family nutrient-binding outer membrane lipoprotein n=1 Tax=Rubrivirga litoralis TaxID=3075598 RepID=A0ABU3BP28_9BACT|nr:MULTISPECIES: SusD/RagB family nutrient-binding outer membrane lipoprotein [unclassified Rubrivirga]MDT0631042.1 SusD/RagB family nutrient-binding outer membrane lipoprotein [Rubrivirga sp. F394]MDT7855068.1 SusD/RagB family nutrient-binding outer membrane lipoprotein [Rubrivirga sp. S365]